MSAKVPRAPRAGEAPDALRRIAALRSALGREGSRPDRVWAFPCMQVSCVLGGVGSMLLAASALVRLAPRCLFSQLVVALYGSLPWGG